MENTKVLIRDKTGKVEEILSCINRESFIVSWEKNQTYQISFTAQYSESSGFDFNLLQNENFLIFKGQEFVIKQLSPSVSGNSITKEVTATHIYFETQNIWQHNIKKGKLSYLPMDILNFIFSNNKGFSFEVIGSFEKVEIEDLGNCSGLEAINKCIEKFDCVVVPDNRHIKIVKTENWQQQTDKIFQISETNVSIDTTAIQNMAWLIGKEKETESTSDSVSDTPEYYFEPFLYRNEASIKKWGERPGENIEDDRFTDKNHMINYAEKTLQLEPVTELTIVNDDDTIYQAGDVVFLKVKGVNISTYVTVTGIISYPLSYQYSEITLDNTKKTMTDIQLAIASQAKNTHNYIQNLSFNFGKVRETMDGIWQEEDVKKYYG